MKKGEQGMWLKGENLEFFKSQTNLKEGHGPRRRFEALQ
jgi:hypothetical protein